MLPGRMGQANRQIPAKMMMKSPTEKLLDRRRPAFHVKKHSLVFKNDTYETEEETQRNTNLFGEEVFPRTRSQKMRPKRPFPSQLQGPFESLENNQRGGKSIFYDDLDSSVKPDTREHNSKNKSSRRDFVDTFCENTFRQKSKKKQQFTFKKSNKFWHRGNSNPQLLSLDSKEINNFRASENSDQLLTSKRDGSRQKGEVYDNIVLSIRNISQSRSSRTSINRETLRSHRRLRLKENIGLDLSVNKNTHSNLYHRIQQEQKQETRLSGNKFSFEAKKESERSQQSMRQIQKARSVSHSKQQKKFKSKESWKMQRQSRSQNKANVNVSDYLKVEKKKGVKLNKRRKKKLSIETKNAHIVNQTWNMNNNKRRSEEFVTKNNFTFKSKKKIIYEGFGIQSKKPHFKKNVKDMRPNFTNGIISKKPQELLNRTLNLHFQKQTSQMMPEMISKTLETDHFQSMSKTRQRFYSNTYEQSEKNNQIQLQKNKILMIGNKNENNIILSIKDLTPKHKFGNSKKQDLKRLLLSNDKSTPCFEKCLSTKSIHKTPKVRPKKLFKSNKKTCFKSKQSKMLKDSAKNLISQNQKPANLIVYSRSKKKKNQTSISRNNFGTIKKRTSNERNQILFNNSKNKKGINSKRISSMLQNVEQSNKEIYSRLKQFENDYRNLTTGPNINKNKPSSYNPSFLIKKDVFPKNFEKEIEKINLDFQKKTKKQKKKDHLILFIEKLI